MTHNTTLAVKNRSYYGKESLFLYQENLLKQIWELNIQEFLGLETMFVLLVKIYALPLMILVRFLPTGGT